MNYSSISMKNMEILVAYGKDIYKVIYSRLLSHLESLNAKFSCKIYQFINRLRKEKDINL